MADRAAFHFARGMLTRSGVAAFHFEPSVALERTEQLIRTILRHESVVLAVRGPLPFAISGSPALRQECERRRATFDTGLANLCESLHITYQGFSPRICTREPSCLATGCTRTRSVTSGAPRSSPRS